MRVLRTVTIENSAATKTPLAKTRASIAARRQITVAPRGPIPDYPISCFAIAEEVRIDELIDHRLVGGIHLFELDAHADAPVAPGDAPFGVDVALRARHAKPHLDLRAALE